jgi:hypothetical protein
VTHRPNTGLSAASLRRRMAAVFMGLRRLRIWEASIIIGSDDSTMRIGGSGRSLWRQSLTRSYAARLPTPDVAATSRIFY